MSHKKLQAFNNSYKCGSKFCPIHLSCTSETKLEQTRVAVSEAAQRLVNVRKPFSGSAGAPPNATYFLLPHVPGSLEEAPENRPGREAGSRLRYRMSAEGAVLYNCGKFNYSKMLAVDVVPHLRRSFPFHSSLPALRPGLVTVGPLDLKSKK